MPYIYSYAHEASVTGIPIARAMVIDHQHDPLAWKYDLQYLWGNEMLVAPNCADSGTVNVWLPKGIWYDFWSDEKMNGDQIIPYPSPLGKLPLFIKAGSIIPMRNYAVSTKYLRKDTLVIQVYTGNDASFILYEDDGITERYRTNNESRTTQISFYQSEFLFTIGASAGKFSNAPAQRAVRIEFHGIQKVPCPLFNGVPLTQYRTETDAAVARQGMVWNEKRKTLTVFLKKASVADPINISSLKNCK